MSPLTLNRGFPHSGQTSESMVAPDFRRSAMRFTSSDNFRMISVRSNSLGGWAVYKSHDNPRCAVTDSSRSGMKVGLVQLPLTRQRCGLSVRANFQAYFGRTYYRARQASTKCSSDRICQRTRQLYESQMLTNETWGA